MYCSPDYRPNRADRTANTKERDCVPSVVERTVNPYRKERHLSAYCPTGDSNTGHVVALSPNCSRFSNNDELKCVRPLSATRFGCTTRPDPKKQQINSGALESVRQGVTII